MLYKYCKFKRNFYTSIRQNLDGNYLKQKNRARWYGEMLDPIYHFPVLEKNIRDSLFNVNLLQKNLIKEKKENIKKNLFKIKTNIFIDNDASNKHTILEINKRFLLLDHFIHMGQV